MTKEHAKAHVFYRILQTYWIMQYPRYLIAALILFAFLVFAGCTQAPAPGTPSASPGAPADMTRLLLDPADLPPNFTLVESTAKDPADVGSLAKDLGWEGGYGVRYALPAIDNRGPTEITQSIALYPEKNILAIVELSDKQDRSDANLVYTGFATPGLGNNSRGFFGNASAEILVKPTNENPLVSGPGNHDVAVVYTREVAEIIFTKGDVFEVLRMSGPGANVTVLRDMAGKTFRKIP
jgi:hypothetical protein